MKYQWVRKAVGLLLALVMAVSMACPAFASDNGEELAALLDTMQADFEELRSETDFDVSLNGASSASENAETLANYILSNGTLENGYYHITGTDSSSNTYIVSTITYRTDLEYLLFHCIITTSNGGQVVASFDYDIAAGAAASKVSVTALKEFTLSTTEIFDIASYTFDTELEYELVSGSSEYYDPLAENIITLCDYGTKILVQECCMLIMEATKLTPADIGFTSLLTDTSGGDVGDDGSADIWDGSVTAPTATTTKNGVTYYEISKCSQLAYVAKTGGDWLQRNYILTRDLVLNDVELTYNISTGECTATEDLLAWTPIGNNKSALTYYWGRIDGDGHTISGLYVYLDGDYAGLVGAATDCTVTNLNIENAYVRGDSLTGGIIGYASSSTITNCSFSGMVKAASVTDSVDGVGGICGFSSGPISNCSMEGVVLGNRRIGGIVGYSQDSISGCVNRALVRRTSSGENFGGIAGIAESVENCYNTGDITGGTVNCGGIAGRVTTLVSNCYNTGRVNSSSSRYVGAVAGFPYGSNSVARCFYLKNETVNSELFGTGGYSSGSDSGCQSATEAEMQKASLYSSWDFDYTWAIDSTKNDGYPYLQWETPADASPEMLEGKVVYYLQNISDDGYSSVDGGTVSGFEGDLVSAPAGDFTGFTEETSKGVHVALLSSDTVLTRYYARNSYTITFETGDGSDVSDITARYEAAVTAPASPDRSGCEFAGWYSDEALTTAYTFTTMPSENITLYAKWTVETGERGIEYEITGITLRSTDEQVITSIPEDSFYAEVSVKNLSSTQMDTLVLAAYDSSNRMLDIQFLYSNPPIGYTFTFGAGLDNSDGDMAVIKAFMLDRLGGVVPLAETVEFRNP